MSINERIQSLRKLMLLHRIDAYIIPSDDYHQSEYVGDFFKCREYISGFTGSAGTVIITHTSAHLWTDGRYFIQAEKELSNTEYKLHKTGLLNTISIDDFLITELPENGVLAFDGRVITSEKGNHFNDLLSFKNITIKYHCDLIGQIWENRPPLPHEKIFSLSEELTGESVASKLSRLRNQMSLQGASLHILTSLDDIAWLLNLRGNDVAYTPVFLAYAVISHKDILLFLDETKLSENLTDISVQPYDEIYTYVQTISNSDTLLFDPAKLNYRLFKSIPNDIRCIHASNPTAMFKAQKNEVEIANIKKAHLKDAVAHTKFVYWLKHNFKNAKITEQIAADKLEAFRQEQEHFLEPSFSPISAYGANAAMCHYSCTPDTDRLLEEGSFYLTDSGGHYLEGTTDITRTIALGEITQEMKHNYTKVLRGNLALARAHFLYGCSGENLDILARQYLWSSNLDYMHGTGHGIGNLLSVHEGPCSIRWRYTCAPVSLENGMILSNEPGLYIENEYGIRLENTILVRNDICNEYGQFMFFETLTYVPFDLDAIDFSLLSQEELSQLKEYHQKVYDLTSPYLSDNERKWLEQFL